MTVPRFGRVTPIQGYMLFLVGYNLSRVLVGLNIPDEERMNNMRRGLAELRRITSQDFGFDLAAWHRFLLTNPRFGYKHPYAFTGVRQAVEKGIRDTERERLVKLLEEYAE